MGGPRVSQTGIRGVYRAPSRTPGMPDKWVAELNKAGQRVYIGRFDTIEEAHEALKDASEATYGISELPAIMDPYEPTPLERKELDEMEWPVDHRHHASIYNMMKREAV